MKKRIEHIFLMISKNMQAYRALSITIVLSFSIFLGFITWMDTINYNHFKEIMAAPSNVVMAEFEEPSMEKNLCRLLEQDNISYEYYMYLKVNGHQMQENTKTNFIYYGIPNSVSRVFDGSNIDNYMYPDEIHIKSGVESFCIEKNEAIIEESFLHLLGKTYSDLPFEYETIFEESEDQLYRLNLKIVGVCEDSQYGEIKINSETGDIESVVTRLYVNQKTLSEYDLSQNLSIERGIVITSNQPERVAAYMRSLGMIAVSAAESKSEVNQQMRNQAQMKTIVLLLLMIILGVNMFGSMANVIAKREYEIGIKRAVGATAKNIVFQFFGESMAIMLVDMLIAVLVVSILSTIAKIFIFLTQHGIWTVKINRFSILSYLVASTSIILIFSLYLAYRATKVEIVSQLKSE